ncbi:MAG: ABC transporter ATP-binding protein [Parachlamydiales bacterium]
MKTAISVKNVFKTYPNGKIALHGINIDLEYGSLVGLIGPNGAGKSTLIHIIAGVIKHDKGTIDCHIPDSKEIAWVSQFSCIDWYLPVIDNVRLGARLGGYGLSEAEEVSKKWLTTLELQHKSYCKPDALSGGEQRRMQIARALAQNAKILILDEPTTGLDPIASKILMQSLKQLSKQNCLIILSSHDLHLIENDVDRILFLNEGSLIANLEIESIKRSANNLHEYYTNTMSKTSNVT